jgi:hypothetical protein
MTVTNALLRRTIVLCVVAIQPLVNTGCAGAGPTRAGERAGGPVPKIVFTAGGGGSSARASELLATLVEARIKKEKAQISSEYLPDTAIADKRGAEAVGCARHADVVVWSKDAGEGEAELQITVVRCDESPAATGSTTLSIPWDGGTRKELFPGEADTRVEPPADFADIEWAPADSVGASPDVGPIPTAPGKWDPPGDQPGNFYYGREVHKNIASFYGDQHQGDVLHTNDVPINSIAQKAGLAIPKVFSESRGLYRPDIFNVTKQHLYEIKPAKVNEMVDGVAKAGLYYAALKEVGFRQVKLGPAGEPGTSGMVSVPGGYAYFSVVVPGLIAYTGVRNKPTDFSRLFLNSVSYALLEELRERYEKLQASPRPGPPPVAVPTVEPFPLPPIPVPSLLPSAAPVPSITVKVGAPTITADEMTISVFLYMIRQAQLPTVSYSHKESLKRDIAQAMNTTLETAAAVLFVTAAAIILALS